jgi:hypothetical protein
VRVPLLWRNLFPFSLFVNSNPFIVSMRVQLVDSIIAEKIAFLADQTMRFAKLASETKFS